MQVGIWLLSISIKYAGLNMTIVYFNKVYRLEYGYGVFH